MILDDRVAPDATTLEATLSDFFFSPVVGLVRLVLELRWLGGL
jgi:hypothetical protein